MPILGLIDAATFANTVAVTINSPTVTKNAADEIAAGDIIVLGGVRYFVKAVVSDTEITLGTDYTGTTNAALAGAQRRTAPKALADYIIRGGDSAAGDVQIIGLSRAEAQLANNKARGLSMPGWWAYRTYTDGEGNTRHKAECIASFKDGSRVSGDFADEPAAADALSVVTIDTQPTAQSTSTPAGGILTFTDNGAADGSRTPGTYTITDAAGSVAGTLADFTVVVAGDGTPTITKVSGGTGYAAAETITINDADLGGGGGAAVVITVSTVATADATFSVVASVTGAGSAAYQWQVSTDGGVDFADIAGATSANLALTGLTTTENGNYYRVKVGTGAAGAAEVVSAEVKLTVTAA